MTDYRQILVDVIAHDLEVIEDAYDKIEGHFQQLSRSNWAANHHSSMVDLSHGLDALSGLADGMSELLGSLEQPTLEEKLAALIGEYETHADFEDVAEDLRGLLS